MRMRKQEVMGVRSQRVIKVEEIDKLDHFKVLIALIPNVSSSGHEPNVIFLPQRWELMGSNLLIPLGLGSIIIDDGLPHLPSLNHGEVLKRFSMRLFLRKKDVGCIS